MTTIVYERSFFADLNGKPLDSGTLFIGFENQDPETHPIDVFWDFALTVPAAQPLSITAGYVTNNGIRAAVYVGQNSYSLRARNRANVQVDYVASATGFPGGSNPPPPSVVQIDPQIATADQTYFVFTDINSSIIAVQVNGQTFSAADYTAAGNTITFALPRYAGDVVQPYVLGIWGELATITAPGLMSITDKIKSDGVVDMKAIGAQYNNDFDNFPIFTEAFGLLGARGSGRIDVGHYGMLYCGSSLTPPPGVHIKGQFHPGVQLVRRWDYLDVCPSGIIMEPTSTISGDAFKMEHMLIWQANINQNPMTEAAFYTELAKYEGTALTVGHGGDVTINQNMFIGWNKAGLFNQCARPEITRNMVDCNNGFEVTQCYDFKNEGISYNVANAYLILNKPFSLLSTRRSGKFIYVHDVADAVNVQGNNSFGYQCGLHLKDVFEVKASHIADNPGLINPAWVTGCIGILLEGNCNGVFLDKSGAHGNDVGYKFDTGSGPPIFIGSNSVGTAVSSQVLFGAGARGHFDNFYVGGPCDIPIRGVTAVGRWSGNIVSWSTPTSGKLIVLDDIADKNNFLRVSRQIFDATAVDDIPYGVGVYTWAGRPGDPQEGDRAIFTDSPTATWGAVISAGGGGNAPQAGYHNGQWKVVLP